MSLGIMERGKSFLFGPKGVSALYSSISFIFMFPPVLLFPPGGKGKWDAVGNSNSISGIEGGIESH